MSYKSFAGKTKKGRAYVGYVAKSKGSTTIHTKFYKKRVGSKKRPYNTAWRRTRAEKRLSNPGIRIKY